MSHRKEFEKALDEYKTARTKTDRIERGGLSGGLFLEGPSSRG